MTRLGAAAKSTPDPVTRRPVRLDLLMQRTSPRTSALAVASFIVSLLFCACGLQGFVAIPLAMVAMVRIRRSSNTLGGMPLAATALVVGVLGVGLSVGIGGLFGFGIAREREVRPIAEALVRDVSEGELESARARFVPDMREAPGTMPTLAGLSEILQPLGELNRLDSSGFQMTPGSFRAEYDGVFARGRASIEVGFTEESGEWLVDAFFVQRRDHRAPTAAPTAFRAWTAEEMGVRETLRSHPHALLSTVRRGARRPAR